jgi:stage II sporulation protein D
LGVGNVNVEADGKTSHLALKEKVSVTAFSRRIKIGSRDWPSGMALTPSENGQSVSINGRLYRGKIELRTNGSRRVTAINELPVDDYVRGILLHEVSPDWPEEALKAQCVISRTYALSHRGRHSQNGFDLCNQTHCQVYGGRSSERDSIDRAVEETEDEVLVYRGALVNAVFHSCCGGATEECDNVWEGEGAPPYLQTVRCRWCKRAPQYNWTSEIPIEQIAKGLKAAGVNIGMPRGLKVTSRSRSGRAVTVRVSGSRGSAEMKANAFRVAVDSRAVKSTLWTVVSTGRSSWKFSGHGWGHGVGLCQWGTKEQAEAGRSYEQILKFYYKDVSLTKYRP